MNARVTIINHDPFKYVFVNQKYVGDYFVDEYDGYDQITPVLKALTAAKVSLEFAVMDWQILRPLMTAEIEQDIREHVRFSNPQKPSERRPSSEISLEEVSECLLPKHFESILLAHPSLFEEHVGTKAWVASQFMPKGL